MGFPTANVAVSDQLVPADGVYAGRATVRGETHPCGISIGKTPTFGGSERMIEAHLLDFAGELYDEVIRLEFAQWLREQRTFDSADALADQLTCDIAAVRRGLDPAVPDRPEGAGANQ